MGGWDTAPFPLCSKGPRNPMAAPLCHAPLNEGLSGCPRLEVGWIRESEHLKKYAGTVKVSHQRMFHPVLNNRSKTVLPITVHRRGCTGRAIIRRKRRRDFVHTTTKRCPDSCDANVTMTEPPNDFVVSRRNR